MDKREGRRLDPSDWDGFEAAATRLLAECVGYLHAARDHPWQPPPDDMRAALALGGVGGQDPETVMATMRDDIMPYATGNIHPAFWGWVHGTGSAIGVAAEMVAATMNANCGGRDHGAMQIEAAVIDWLTDLAGLGDQAFGVMTSGTSQATILALNVARFQRFGARVRQDGVAGLPPVAVYAAEGAHACIGQALEVMGHGLAALRAVPAGPDGMDVAALREMLAQDRAQGIEPLAVVATAGSVNTGVFDPINALADLCAELGIWLHVDAAFGFWTLLADAPWDGLAAGIGRADSIALDFHKWIGVPYAAGACLVRDRDLHRNTFVARPDYLTQGAGLAGGTPWFTDYGLELSRGFGALKVWAVVKTAGTGALGAAISDNCRQAALMGRLVDESPLLRLAHKVVSNICCFEPLGADAAKIAARLQTQGQAVFSTTRIEGVTCLRAAIVNHRTTVSDIHAAIKSVENSF